MLMMLLKGIRAVVAELGDGSDLSHVQETKDSKWGWLVVIGSLSTLQNKIKETDE